MPSRFHRDVDVRPLHYRIVDALRECPDGASTAHLSEIIGDAQQTISGVVSKMFSYGGPIEKIGRGGSGPAVRWRLKPAARSPLPKYQQDTVSA